MGLISLLLLTALPMPYSTCTKRVWTTAKEIGVDVTIVPVDLAKGAHKDPAYIENYHPFGIIPVLEVGPDEDGTKIYESRAIARYLVAKYGKGSPLLPAASDAKAYGLFEQAASIEYSSFDPSASGLAFERVFGPMRGLEPNKDLVKKYVDTLDAKLDGYERILAKQKYLTFTLADLFHLPYGKMVYDLEPQLFSKREHLKNFTGGGKTFLLVLLGRRLRNSSSKQCRRSRLTIASRKRKRVNVECTNMGAVDRSLWRRTSPDLGVGLPCGYSRNHDC
ncbi:glutathione S-transferase [Rhizoctonia solani AG-1 IA]|uniref:glutathione transferase n=1 Tax=Thanatephorus cucumeris (strain AG1-IA) TaxID=983506 RepID=L8X9D7_THACA|nr:glutathione S-transferase [Rhizoctonia solani AG-1 IA]